VRTGGVVMALYRKKYRIETARLAAWDYSSPGYYFVTICTAGKHCWFGDIVDAEIVLSDLGRAARDCWAAIPGHFPLVALEESIIMPNHVHGIVVIQPGRCPSQNSEFGPQSRNLGSIIRGYKIGVKKYATEHGSVFEWQPRFYEHIIRSGESLARIRNYIATNPARWEFDEYHSPSTRHA
jgi:putative transposase